MGNQGRYGKYGEIKRANRLRSSRTDPPSSNRAGIGLFTPRPSYKNILAKKPIVTLRQARNSDSRFIRQLSGKVFNIYGPYDEILPDWLNSDNNFTIIACMGKKSVGFAMLGDPFNRYDLQPVTELLAIAVDPKNQGKGIAELLLREVERKAAHMKIKRIFLHTATGNLRAQRLFTKMGYRPWEIKRSFYPEGQDAMVMSMEPSVLS